MAFTIENLKNILEKLRADALQQAVALLRKPCHLDRKYAKALGKNFNAGHAVVMLVTDDDSGKVVGARFSVIHSRVPKV